MVWCRNASHKYQPYVLAEVITHRGTCLPEVEINGKQHIVLIDQIRRAELPRRHKDNNDKEDWWYEAEKTPDKNIDPNLVMPIDPPLRKSTRGIHPRRHFICKGY